MMNMLNQLSGENSLEFIAFTFSKLKNLIITTDQAYN